jgi:hypothetical protein
MNAPNPLPVRYEYGGKLTLYIIKLPGIDKHPFNAVAQLPGFNFKDDALRRFYSTTFDAVSETQV